MTHVSAMAQRCRVELARVANLHRGIMTLNDVLRRFGAALGEQGSANVVAPWLASDHLGTGV